MRYSTKTKYKRYVKGYDSLSYARKFWDKQTASERVVQKTAETTGDLTGNKIADKTTSVGNTKSKEKEYVTNKRQGKTEHY